MPSAQTKAFKTLTVHFFNRLFDTDQPSGNSLPRTRLIQTLAFVCVLSGLLLYLLLRTAQPAITGLSPEASRDWQRIGIHFTFVCYSMMVLGLVMTVKWDSLFPDRRDYLILASLPISGQRLFAAKGVAVAAYLSLFALAANVLPALAVAVLESSALLSHLAAVAGASLFAILLLAAVQGVLLNVLSPAGFRRISPLIQTVSITLLVVGLLVAPVLNISLRLLTVSGSSLPRYFPAVWFVGVYEVFSSPSTSLPDANAWAWLALEGIIGVAVVAAGTYTLGYYRLARKVLEAEGTDDVKPNRGSGWLDNLFCSCLLISSQQRAVFEYIGRASSRSARHRIVAAAYSGLGVALGLSSLLVLDLKQAFPFVVSESRLLEAPAILTFVVVAGWAATFGIPSELSANWVFQLSPRASAPEFRKAIRKWLFVCRILPLYVLVAAFEFFWFDAGVAAAHLAVDLISTAFLVEAFFFGFSRVPYTCNLLRRKLHISVYAVAFLYAFTTYGSMIGTLKSWVGADTQLLERMFAVSAMLLGCIWIYRALCGAEASKMLYDAPDQDFQQLNLF